MQKETFWSSWAPNLPIVSLGVLSWGVKVWGLLVNLWAPAQASLCWAMGAMLSVCPSPFCPTKEQHFSDPGAGERWDALLLTRCSLLLPSPQTPGLMPDSRGVSASLPSDVSGAKISLCRKDKVLCTYIMWIEEFKPHFYPSNQMHTSFYFRAVAAFLYFYHTKSPKTCVKRHKVKRRSKDVANRQHKEVQNQAQYH